MRKIQTRKSDHFFIRAPIMSLFVFFLMPVTIARADTVIYAEPEPTFTYAWQNPFDGNHTVNSPWTILNDNKPIGVSGTVQGYIIKTPNHSADWVVSVSQNNNSASFGVMECASPIGDNAFLNGTCSGGDPANFISIGQGVVNSIEAVGSDNLKITLQNRFEINPNKYYAVSVQPNAGQGGLGYNDGTTYSLSGLDTGACRMTSADGAIGQMWDCSALGGMKSFWVSLFGLTSENNATSTQKNDNTSATITLITNVTNNNGGNNVVSDFQLFLDNGVVTTSVTSGVPEQMNAGTYTVSEAGVSGYAPSFSGDCDANGNVTLVAGDNKTCTIINDDLPPSITLIKQVSGGTATPAQFRMRVDGALLPSGTSRAVTSNTPHTISEDAFPGYHFVSITGSPKCPTVSGGSITLDEGESVTCTITNAPDGGGGTPPITPPTPVAGSIYGIPFGFTFTGDLQLNQSSTSVRYLQILLNSNPETRVVTTDALQQTCWKPNFVAGAGGCETEVFGPSTKDAVINFQEKYRNEILTPAGLTAGTGLVGQLTRTKLNSILVSGLAARGPLLDDADRKGNIVNSVHSLWTSLRINTAMPGLPEALVLAIAAQETGTKYHFNNEWTRINDVRQAAHPDQPNDLGRGIMQITSSDNVARNEILTPLASECKNNFTLNYQCSKYYANTSEGIMHNMSDGVNTLKIKYDKFADAIQAYADNTTSNHKEIDHNNGNSWTKDINGNPLQYPIFPSEMKIIAGVKGYNGFTTLTPSCLRLLNNPNPYLTNVANRLASTSEIYSGTDATYSAATNLAEKLKIADANKENLDICSPGTLKVIDGDGNITTKQGDTEISEVPLALYDFETGKHAEILFPTKEYKYQVIGTEAGTYTFFIDNTTDEGKATVELHGVPLGLGEIYTYQVDWDKIGRGEKGVTIQIDKTGDGIIDSTTQVGAFTDDTVAPTTTPTVTGPQGTNGWYVGTTTVTLLAQDNPGGVGVDKTFYSLDDGAFATYVASSSISIGADGVHTLQFYSTDFFGNQEATSTLVIKIDHTPPEATIAFDSSTKKLKIAGIDSLSTTTVLTTSTSSLVTDEAGNTLKILFAPAKQKDGRIALTINSLLYNGVAKALSNIVLKYKWGLKNSAFTMFAEFVQSGATSTEGHYRPKKNITLVMSKPQDLNDQENDDDSDTRPVRQVLPGMVVVGLRTNNGTIATQVTAP